MIIEKTPTLVNRERKNILAKCMAMEDLRVIHDATAETAYFDTKNRVLCLPVWKDMSNSVYDMLVGHEVSHALHTPCEGWEDFVGKGKGSQIRHMFLNIVEDARIERLIKDKFPGLKRDFVEAYKHMHTVDMFELKNRTIDSSTPLIDRLNLEFKLGLFGHVDIPFTDVEKPYVTRMAETVTFEEVVKLAEELYEKHQDELEEEEEENQPESGSESGDGEEGESQEGSQGQSNDDTGESQEGDEDGENEGSGSESGDDSGQSQTDDTDDGEGAESETNSDSEPNGDTTNDDYQEGCSTAGSTQNALENSVKNLRDEQSNGYSYKKLPKVNLENCVASYKEIDALWQEYNEKIQSKNDDYMTRILEQNDKSLQDCNIFLNRIKSTVAQMVQRFQMKQAADADKRTNISKSGVLDTCSMINYRWSEDIFLKNETHDDAKNHGIVMYLDWSGSMNGILKDTVEQLLILTQFCQKVNIPFEVYAFTSKQLKGLDSDGHPSTQELSSTNNRPEYLHIHSFSLLQFLSSDMKTNEYKIAVQRLYHLGASSNYYGGHYPSELGLGCTPLNEAIMCAFTQIPEFQAKHGVQIVNTVFLTDGDGSSLGGGRSYGTDKSIIHDPKTRKDYIVGEGRSNVETDTYLKILQERTGTNLIGIRLIETKSISRLQYRYFPDQNLDAHAKSWTKNNFTSIVGQGYDKLFIVRGNLKVETEALDNLTEDASYVKIKNAFMKGSNNQKSTRVIATQLVDIIAQ
jgi:cobalamin biosynthesis protein CobT